jgi:hypothetical protein
MSDLLTHTYVSSWSGSVVDRPELNPFAPAPVRPARSRSRWFRNLRDRRARPAAEVHPRPAAPPRRLGEPYPA